ncbi:TadE/TadG family type IV pilus assembly protein [Phenylobacterium sp.]|uniref:TadE/TadG family type IV pilus assembly protein n=1 Tax=Phenylobacterium sp. TaxID=1871053 RepID=UPI00391B8A78
MFRPLPFILRDRRGTAAIEFAIIAPVLILLVVAAIEFGFAIRAQLQAQEAASAGALYAMQNGWNSAQISAAVTGATGETGLAATPAPRRFYGCPTASGITETASGASCGDGTTARTYVEVSATLPRKSILPNDFGLPDDLTAHSTARLP